MPDRRPSPVFTRFTRKGITDGEADQSEAHLRLTKFTRQGDALQLVSSSSQFTNTFKSWYLFNYLKGSILATFLFTLRRLSCMINRLLCDSRLFVRWFATVHECVQIPTGILFQAFQTPSESDYPLSSFCDHRAVYHPTSRVTWWLWTMHPLFKRSSRSKVIVPSTFKDMEPGSLSMQKNKSIWNAEYIKVSMLKSRSYTFPTSLSSQTTACRPQAWDQFRCLSFRLFNSSSASGHLLLTFTISPPS